MTKPLNLSRGIGLILFLLCTLTLSANTTTKTANLPPPEIVCPDDTQQLISTKNMQRVTGSLDENDNSISLSDYGCFHDFFQAFDGDHAYDLVTFSPNITAWYTFFLGTNFAGNVSLHQGDLNLDNPCQNLIDGIATSYTLPIPSTLPLPDQRIGIFLQAGETYSLLISNQEAGTSGDWELTAYNDEGGILSVFDSPSPQLLAFDLLWSDVKPLRFKNPQQWLVNADGSLDTVATLSTFFNNDEEQFNSFLVKLNYTGMPTMTSDCDLLITVSDQLTSNSGCGNILLTRNFQAQAEDSSCSDIISSCQQVFTFRRLGLTDIQWPPYQITIPCDEEFLTDGAVGGPDENPNTQVTYAPTLLSGLGYRDLPSTLGNFSIFYSDEPRVIVCDGSYKLRRQWHLGDWCSFPGNTTFQQYITIGDNVGPILSNYLDTLTIFVSPFDCNGYAPIPIPDVEDGNGCSDAALTNFFLEDNQGNLLVYGLFPASTTPLPIGDYKIISCAEDDCGNETCVETILLVRDNVAPAAQCQESLTTLIGGGDTANGIEGISRVFTSTFDNGSNDNCGEVYLDIRRNYWQNSTCSPSANQWSTWGDYVDFYCCDQDQEIMVELRLTDDAGNQSVCSTIVTVNDELSPYCFSPTDIALNLISLPEGYPADIATAYETDFAATSSLMNEIFGAASGTDNCAVDTIVEITPIIQLNECGAGTITRRFKSWQAMTDADFSDGLQEEEVYPSTNQCVQTITIQSNHSFTIAFPADAQVGCDNPDVIGLEISAGDCDVLSVNTSEPVIYPGTNEACYELAITYDVINWSVWDGVSEAFEIARITEEDGQLWAAGYTVEPAERPIISITSSFGPDDENCDGVLDTSESGAENNNDLRYILTIDRSHPGEDGDSDITDLIYDNIADSPADCIPTQSYGRYIYTQLISVSNIGAPEILVDNFGGPTEFCPGLSSGQFGDYTGSCDTEVTITFSIAYDCAAHEELHSLLSLGAVTAELDTFATDLNTDSEITADEFSSEWDVSESIINNGDGSYTFSGNLPIITSAMGENIYHALKVQFTDNCGNGTTRIITFDVVDCKGPTPICINGLTTTLMPIPLGTDVNDDGIEDTHLSILRAADFEGSPISDCTGQGPDSFLGLPRVNSYAIYLAEYVDSDPLFVPSPADSLLYLTQEGEETTIVYIYAFDNEGNYDFCETYVLVQFSNCAPFGCLDMEGVITTEEEQVLEGVQVHVTHHPINFSNFRLTDDSGFYRFSQLHPYFEYTITPTLDTDHSNGITAADINRLSDHLSGTTLLASPYQLIAADVDGSGSITDNDLMQLQQLFEGTISTFPNNASWLFVDAAYVFPDPANPWLEDFPESLHFSEMTTDITDADFIGIKIGDLDGSAAGISPQDRGVQLEEERKSGLAFATGEASSKRFEVYQNTPNPFATETSIGFNLPQDSEVIITITDLTGKQLLVRKGNYPMGYNSIKLTKDMLQSASGVLNYTITTAEYAITKRMVVVW